MLISVSDITPALIVPLFWSTPVLLTVLAECSLYPVLGAVADSQLTEKRPSQIK